MGDLAPEQDLGGSFCRDRDGKSELGSKGSFPGAAKAEGVCPGEDVSTTGGSWVMLFPEEEQTQ